MLSLLPKCCGPVPGKKLTSYCIRLYASHFIAEVVAQDEHECRCITLPTGESICDPWHCKNEGMFYYSYTMMGVTHHVKGFILYF